MQALVAMRNYILQSTQMSAEQTELRSRLQLVENVWSLSLSQYCY